MHTIIHGDCLEEMKKFPDNYFSAIVTDPPYGLSFMNKGWDHAVPRTEYWKECLRIAKPGSYLLAMGGTRTFHRLASVIEDSGLEIRDCLMWLYGSGFPKSHNHFGIEGYGTALKPAWEPIIMAMKRCDGTFAQNAEKWGQAGINIDECRIGFHEYSQEEWTRKGLARVTGNTYGEHKSFASELPKGRWPANVILDEEAAKRLDEMNGNLKSGDPGIRRKPHSGTERIGQLKNHPIGHKQTGFGDSGGASRFFYCAKASSSERGEDNRHPTVKPLKLMEYLIKLVMPPKNGLLLDPFAGSGTTILAAKRLGFDAIGIEKQPEYCEIAQRRIDSILI